jgi:predicted nucleotide-binding protein
MAKKRQPPARTEPQPAQMTVDQMRKAITILSRRVAELEQFQPGNTHDAAYEALEKSIQEALERSFGRGTNDYDRYLNAATLDHGPVSIDFLGRGSTRDTRKYIAEGKASAIATLKGAIKTLEERIADEEFNAENHKPSVQPARNTDSIFIDHGHDGEVKQSVARFVENLGLTAVILDEQASQGMTIIEKLERHTDVGYAIVLLTPDDVGGKSADDLRRRPRQNVVLELGLFVGRLGRDRVCAVVRGKDIELPSDIQGLVWTEYEGDWKFKEAKELKAAGYDIDMNKAV